MMINNNMKHAIYENEKKTSLIIAYPRSGRNTHTFIALNCLHSSRYEDF